MTVYPQSGGQEWEEAHGDASGQEDEYVVLILGEIGGQRDYVEKSHTQQEAVYRLVTIVSI